MVFFVIRCACVLLAVIASLVLGLGVILRRRRPVLHRIFALMALVLAFYEFSVFRATTAQLKTQASFWIQASNLGIYVFSCVLLFFSYTFLHNRVLGRWLWKYAFITLVTGVSVALLFPTFIVDIDMSGLAPVAIYSRSWSAFAVLVTLNALLSVSNFYRTWRREKGLRHAQAPYLLFGVLGFWALGAAIGFLFPLASFTELEGVGAAASILMLLPIGYAIMRYRLFDFSSLARRLITFFINCLFLVLVYGVVFSVFGFSFSFHTSVPFEKTVFCLLVASVISSALLLRVRRRVQQAMLRYLIPDAYDTAVITQALSNVFRKVSSLDRLLSEVLQRLCQDIGISDARIFLRLKGSDRFVLAAQEGTPVEGGPVEIDPEAAFIRQLRPGEDVLIREEWQRFHFDSSSRAIQDDLERLQAEVVVPLGVGKDLTGLIALGPKNSGYIYAREDIEFFLLLSNQLAISIENSVLYSELRDDKLYQQTILNNLSSGVMTVDLSMLLTTFNKTAREMLDISVEKALGTPIGEISRTFDRMLRKALEEKKRVFQEEVFIELASGRRLPLSLNLSPLRNAEGQVIGGLVVFTDLSALKQLQMEMRRTERLASLGTLAAGVAHEIKNPLVSIKTFAQLFPERYADQEFRTSFYQLAAKEIDRINSLVEHLLDLAKPPSVAYKPIHISRVLDEIIDTIEAELQRRHIEMRRDYQAEEAVVAADGQQMKQVFLNFLMNAMDSIGAQGRIQVRTRQVSGPLDGVGASPLLSGEHLRVEIEDSGGGIPEEALEKIFDPFYTTKAEGTGLGLSISHKIISDHGGAISVDSRPGRTVFSIYLPVVFQEALATS